MAEGTVRLPAGTTRVEWGLAMDCAKNGCDPPHEDDGYVMKVDEQPKAAHPVNNHATHIVRRLVHATEWMPHIGGRPDADRI